MAFRLTKTEPYPFELPITPPTPYPSPTLQYASLHTPLTHNLPKDGNPELRSLTCSHYGVSSLSNNPKVTGEYATRPSNTQRQSHPTLIDPQIQNSAQHNEQSQQRYSLTTRFTREAPMPNDSIAWWRDTNAIRSTVEAATPASTLLHLGQIADEFRTGCNLLYTKVGTDCSIPPSATRCLCAEQSKSLLRQGTFSGSGAGYVAEAVRFNVGPHVLFLPSSI